MNEAAEIKIDSFEELCHLLETSAIEFHPRVMTTRLAVEIVKNRRVESDDLIYEAALDLILEVAKERAEWEVDERYYNTSYW